MLGRDDFAGAWVLQRTIKDRHLGQVGDFCGTAEMRARGDAGLSYTETGRVRFGDGPELTATREYVWAFDAGGVAVAFADGAPFHRFMPVDAGAGTDHSCGDDFYRVQYDFTAWPLWSAVWTVSGPRKDYTSVSRYSLALGR